MAQERVSGESNLDKKLMGGGIITALVGAGIKIGVLVAIGELAFFSGAGLWGIKKITKGDRSQAK